ncbi:MAG: flagellar hook-basal body complex protein FliE [Gammaproteobacteria bacterium]|nr:flagellar hook-basal body complex protein FliE [Gammaproteobacteria bacterium]
MQIQSATQTDINAVLAQMRALRTQASAGVPMNQLNAIDAPDGMGISSLSVAKGGSFGDALKGAINAVNSLQKTASHGANDFVSGKSSDLVKVMVDSQKASVGFQAMVQVRNRMVRAYQDIMKMPI